MINPINQEPQEFIPDMTSVDEPTHEEPTHEEQLLTLQRQLARNLWYPNLGEINTLVLDYVGNWIDQNTFPDDENRLPDPLLGVKNVMDTTNPLLKVFEDSSLVLGLMKPNSQTLERLLILSVYEGLNHIKLIRKKAEGSGYDRFEVLESPNNRYKSIVFSHVDDYSGISLPDFERRISASKVSLISGNNRPVLNPSSTYYPGKVCLFEFKSKQGVYGIQNQIFPFPDLSHNVSPNDAIRYFNVFSSAIVKTLDEMDTMNITCRGF